MKAVSIFTIAARIGGEHLPLAAQMQGDDGNRQTTDSRRVIDRALIVKFTRQLQLVF